jgi:hypothetical protein
MMMMMMWMWNQPAQVSLLCYLISNIKLTIMLTYITFLPRFQLIQRRRANRRGQDEVFGRNITQGQHRRAKALMTKSPNYNEDGTPRYGSTDDECCAARR